MGKPSRVVPEVSQREDASTYHRLYRKRARPAQSATESESLRMARRRVAKAHPREFERAFAEELAKRGVA